MFGKVLSAFVAGLALASAYTTPVGDPSGNPIYTPNLGAIVPVGSPYLITWGPTTTGTVTIVLLRGPSTNVVPLYPIAQGIDNTGSFSWTPSTDLDDDVTHYGLQLIVDATGQYQYSTQFGISNPGKSSGSSTSPSSSSTTSSSTSSSASSSAVSGGVAYTTEVVTAITTYCPAPTTLVYNNYTTTVTKAGTVTITNCPCTLVRPSKSYTSKYVASTGSPAGNSTVIQPTVPMTVPSTLQQATATSAKASGAALATGAAQKVAAGLGGAAVALVAAVAAL